MIAVLTLKGAALYPLSAVRAALLAGDPGIGSELAVAVAAVDCLVLNLECAVVT
jgi:hypothetical protein